MKSFSVLLFVGTCITFVAQISYAKTVAVGNCRPHLVSYSTISEAVAAVPPNSTVLVCPGNYPEQVTINQPLTLKGLNDGITSRAVITVPTGGVISNFGQAEQLSVQGPDFPVSGQVNISNLVVDGTASGFDCSTGGQLTGIEYVYSSGSLDNVEVRNQSPGGCGFGILLIGSPVVLNTVTIRNSNIHDFDNTGVLAESNGGTGFFVNLTSNFVESASTSVQAVVEYDFTDGLAARNTIVGAGQYGLLLDNFFVGMTAHENTIIGSNVGIYSGGSFGATIITHNNLFNNGTGIFVTGLSGNPVVKSNTIVQSGTVGIDVDCSQDTTAEYNIISGAPVGIANVSSGDTIVRNAIYNASTATTACPF